MGSRPGESNLVEPRGLPSGMAMQPWWTGTGFGAVSPAVMAPGSGAGISLSSNPLGGGAAKGATQGKKTVGDDARRESSDDDSPRSGEPKGSLTCLLLLPLLLDLLLSYVLFSFNKIFDLGNRVASAK
jgi:nuclear transcription factor Y, alpha